MNKLNIIIIEDHESILESFKEIINSSDKFKVTGAFLSGENAIEFINNKNSADIMLVDIQLGGINGIETIKEIKKKNPSILPIIISVHENSKFIFDALCAGAVGYLNKNISPKELITALEQTCSGGAPMSSNIARKVVESFQLPHEKELSERENEVLTLLAKGKSYASIADELFLSINTIKTHTRNIYEKLQVNSKKEIMDKYGKKTK
ncbi:DNA-binding response regulator, NarL/FixJ family, contains REC and HTH domains [Tenacibaculum sp. MAR_2010_89]|uniref:response regulator n=1 Tax=Tenacibaculum sp. MAR_2010_89 TaxID=1250198 RepID=UPI000896F726|nr:response regulator transcription factor [Tenacibaculum sp. MAR_2010_89]SED42316.1 DNA-binding response regulator, NarL/FixJ family, contains REC and HTH domains [Tenacibaculum sp. MAR_2010_89]